MRRWGRFNWSRYYGWWIYIYVYIYVYIYNLTTVDQYYIITVKHYKTISYWFHHFFYQKLTSLRDYSAICWKHGWHQHRISANRVGTASGTQELDCFLCPTPEVLCGIPKPRVWAWVKQVACVGPVWPTCIIRHIGVDVEKRLVAKASNRSLPSVAKNEFDQWIPVVSANIFWNNPMMNMHVCMVSRRNMHITHMTVPAEGSAEKLPPVVRSEDRRGIMAIMFKTWYVPLRKIRKIRNLHHL